MQRITDQVDPVERLYPMQGRWRAVDRFLHPGAYRWQPSAARRGALDLFEGDQLVALVDAETFESVRPLGPDLPVKIRAARRIDLMHLDADNRPPSEGLVYFIGGSAGPIKIGRSIDVRRRLKDLQACSPVPLQLLAVRGGGFIREGAYHAQFARHRLHGEWFERHPEIMTEIDQLRQNVTRSEPV